MPKANSANYITMKKLKNISLYSFYQKALVIIKAKVLVGYDFEKLSWEIDELSRKLKIINFPEPEILSIEPDYKYYNMEENIFNLFSREDLSKIQQNGKNK